LIVSGTPEEDLQRALTILSAERMRSSRNSVPDL
jgi:hypothetical protein